MDFSYPDAVPVLRATPGVLRAWLSELPDSWTTATEGPGTWSPFDVVGHLIHGERTDWMPRIELLLAHGDSRPFVPFDRFAQLRDSRGKSLQDLLDTFAHLRRENVARLDISGCGYLFERTVPPVTTLVRLSQQELTQQA